MTDSPRTSAVAAYRRFFVGWNSRDPRQWAAALHFPHVRVSSRGPVTVVPSMKEHMSGMSWNAVEATGWDHSVETEPNVVHEGENCVHIAGGWTRFTKEDQPILSTHVTYVVTRIGDEWGIQSRLAVDPGATGLTDEHVPVATQVVSDYLASWNERRFAEAARQLNYPAIQVHAGRLVLWNSPEEHEAWLARQPWRKITLTDCHSIQAGPSAVNLALSLEESDRQNQALVLVTLHDGHWGFQAESAIE